MKKGKSVVSAAERRLLDYLQDAAVVTAADWTVVYANELARRLFGQEMETSGGCNLAAAPSLSAYPALFDQLAVSLPERGRWEGAEFAVGPDRRRADIVVEPLEGGERNGGAFLWRFAVKAPPPVSVEATDAQELYYNLAQLASDGVCILQDEVIRYANPQLCNILQRPPEEVVGTPFAQHIVADNLDALHALYHTHLGGARNLGIVESALRARNGERIEVEIDAGIIPFAGRGATLVTLHNITDRVRALAALAESEARYRLVTESSADIIWSYDLRAARLTFVSQAVERVLGVAPSVVTGEGLHRLLPRSMMEQAQQVFDGLFSSWPTERRVAFELDVLDVAGRTVALEVVGTLLGDEGGSPVVATGVARDVTRRRTAERAAARNQEFLRLATDLATRFIGLPFGGVDAAIQDALGQVAELLNAQRGAVFLYRKPGTVCDCTHEWCAPEIASTKAVLQNLAVDQGPSSYSTLASGRMVTVHDTSAPPAEAAVEAQLWRQAGYRAIMIAPLALGGRLAGLLSFVDSVAPREWAAETTALVRNVAAIFASAIQRERAGAALRRSTARLRQVTESSPDIIWSYDLVRRRFRFTSHAMTRILGYSLREASAMTLRGFFPRGEGRKVAAAFDDMLARWPDESTVTVEADHLTKDGRIVPLEIVGKAIAEEDGPPTLVAGVSREISRRREAEQRAARHRELLLLVTELATRFVAAEPDRIAPEVNQALARVGAFAGAHRALVFVYDPAGLVGHRRFEWCAPGYAPAGAPVQELPVARHEWAHRILDAEAPLIVPDTATVPDEAASEREAWRAAGVKAAVGAPISYQGRLLGLLGLDDCEGPRAWDEQTVALLQNVATVFGNAIARAAAHAELRRSDETARALLDGADAIALLADRDGRLLACNRSTALALRRSPEELLGQDGIALLRPSVRAYARQTLAELLQDPKPIRMEREFDQTWYLLSVNPVRDEAQQVARLAFFARDITDIKKREAELRDALRRAQEAEVLKSRFLANMSHEIRTPLNHVIGMTSVLLMQPEMNGEERLGYLKIIKRGGESMLALLTAILNLSKIESGKVDPNLARFDLGEWTAGLRERWSDLAAAKRLSFEMRVDPAIPAEVMGDRAMTEQALDCLVENACKFTKRGGVEVEIRLAAQSEAVGALTIAFAVTDSGIGVSPEDLPHVFDSFFQADSSTTREQGGAGLGLTIARELARILGGRIEAKSEPGEGSVFTLTCPFYRVEVDEGED